MLETYVLALLPAHISQAIQNILDVWPGSTHLVGKLFRLMSLKLIIGRLHGCSGISVNWRRDIEVLCAIFTCCWYFIFGLLMGFFFKRKCHIFVITHVSCQISGHEVDAKYRTCIWYVCVCCIHGYRLGCLDCKLFCMMQNKMLS